MDRTQICINNTHGFIFNVQVCRTQIYIGKTQQQTAVHMYYDNNNRQQK